jgi:hypothetical protein
MKTQMLLAASLAAALLCSDASALTIYRFGGELEPLPPEVVADPDGVDFRQFSWADPVDEDLGGEVYRADLSDGTLRALQFDPNVNIAPTAKGRAGGVRESPRQLEQEKAVDGDLTTSWNPAQYTCASFDPNEVGSRACTANTDYYAPNPPYVLGSNLQSFISGGYGHGGWTINLGGLYAVDRMVIRSGLDDASAIMKNFRVLASSGFWSANGENVLPSSYDLSYLNAYGNVQVFEEIVEFRGNQQQVLNVQFPSARVDFIGILFAEHNQDWAVNEVEIYAKGFAERTSYVSEIIPFGAPTAWGELSWGGTKGADADLRIHTRSGESLEQNVYWKDTGRGSKIPLVGDDTAKQYKRLKLGERAGTTYNRDQWTFWSAPYDFADSSGTAVVSTGPRQFFQFMIDIIPSGDSGGEVKFLEFRTSEPLASALVGEIYPSRAPIAEVSPFTYYLQPDIAADDGGFDGLELTSSSIVNGVVALRIGEVDVALDQDDVVPLDADGQQIASFPAHGFELNFGGRKLTAADTGTPIEVDFDARVLRSGATFDMRALDASQPLAIRQRVNAGDANDLVEGNTVAVATTAGAEQLLRAAATKVFTPNGDGTNDVAMISYDLLEIIGSAAVTIEISDLGGRVVREVYSGADPIGHYEWEWDGRDDADNLVPPGIYVFRIEVDADLEKITELGIVNVAY